MITEQLVEAIEAFIDAKMTYARHYASDPEWASSIDVGETREHLTRVVSDILADDENTCPHCDTPYTDHTCP
jgi:hypothetical protein